MDDEQKLAQALSVQIRSVRDEDAVQDGFVRLIERMGRDTITNPYGYWFTASRNALHDQYRRRAAEEKAIRRWLEIQPRGIDKKTCSDEQLLALLRGIYELQGMRRQLVELELTGMREIRLLADVLGISEGATRVLRHRTYRQLRETFHEIPII